MNATPFNAAVFLDRLNECVARYSGNRLDAGTLSELRALRHEMAQALLSTNPLDLDERFYAGPVGTAHRLLRHCGLRDEPLTANERAFVDNIAHELVLAMDGQDMRIRNLVSTCLLYRDAWQSPLKPGHLRLPQQLASTLLTYIFSSPWAFHRQDDIERYYSYASDMLHWLHDMLLDAGNSADETARLVSDIATPLVSIFSFSPLYFSNHNLKDECAWRAAIMEHVCRFTYGNTYRYRGLSVDHEFQPRGQRAKTRVGILMPQFRPASETFATLPVFEHLDRERFEIILYALKANGGPLERYCASRADRLTEITDRIDQQLRTIREDDLDILFIGTNIMADRSPIGWLALHRLARVQVTSICSPMTTGMRNVDSYIAGELALPADAPQHDYTERLSTVPGSGICFSYGPPESHDAHPLERAQAGIPEQATVYICGSNFFKLLPKVRELYARVIAGVPGSVLVMYPFNPNWVDSYPASVTTAFVEAMQAAFARHGVARERLIILQPRENFAEIRAILRQADVYLDSFPYSGATSIADALQAQLPPVVMDGRYLRFRQAAAMLREMDMSELVAVDEPEYLNLAVKLGSDRDFRAQLVARLRANLTRPGNFLDSRTFSQRMARTFDELLAGYRDGARAVTQGEAQTSNAAPAKPDVPKSLRSALEHHKMLRSAQEHHMAGRLAEAQTLCEHVLQENPGQHKALHLLGLIANQAGENARAIELMNQAIQISPANAVYFYNLGCVYNALHRPDDAAACYRKALAIKPDDSGALNNLGNTCRDQGRLDEAVACYVKVLAITPDDATTLNNLGIALKGQGKLDEAMDCYRKALALNPDDAGILKNLGNTLKEQGRVDEAMDCYRKSLALNPDDARAHNSKLLAAHYTDVLSPTELYTGHLKFAAQFEAPLKHTWRPHLNSRDPERRLKVGYVSPDFRTHSVAYFIYPVLAGHDKSRVETFAYHLHDRHDTFSERIMTAVDHWIPCTDLTDDQLAGRIRADGIDILVDLAGHTGENRLTLFARKPAPVQVTWLGYPDTTGLSAMDYRLTDVYADPPGTGDEFYTEKLVRLPETFLCYRPVADAPEVQPAPALRNGFITFGSFNLLPKINPAVIALWSRILLAVPGSRMLIKSGALSETSVRSRVLGLFGQHGIVEERLTLLASDAESMRHLSRYHEMDIGLDPFPYNGTTTTCEALWMGVPTITLYGDRHSARVGGSLLTNAGLTDLIAHDPDEYVDIAVRLAGDIPGLASLRPGLRQRMATSPLLDGPRLTRHIEAAYRDMWRRWCNQHA